MSDDQDIVAVPIIPFLTEGMPVFDVEGKKVGHVQTYNLEAGYMVVESGTLRRQDFYVPLQAVLTIDRREIYLRMDQDQLARDDTAPPTAEAIPERLDETGGAGAATTVWHELPSGYDGSEIEVDPVDLEAVARQLHVGMTVLDALENYTGEITRLDVGRVTMVVEHTYSGPQSLFIPFDAIASVDSEEELVRLLRPRDPLPEEWVAPPPAGDASRDAGSADQPPL